MRAQLHDREVCRLCNGTGVQVIRTAHGTSARNCNHVPQRELPMDEPHELCNPCHHWVHSSQNVARDFIREAGRVAA